MTRWPARVAELVFSAVASAAFWIGVLALLEGATLFDYSTGAEPNETWVTIKIGAVLVSAPVVYALLLRWRMPVRGGRRWLALLGFAILAGIYWLAGSFIFYGMTAGDRRDGPVGPTTADRIGVLLLVAVLVAVFALLLHGWRTKMGVGTGGTHA